MQPKRCCPGRPRCSLWYDLVLDFAKVSSANFFFTLCFETGWLSTAPRVAPGIRTAHRRLASGSCSHLSFSARSGCQVRRRGFPISVSFRSWSLRSRFLCVLALKRPFSSFSSELRHVTAIDPHIYAPPDPQQARARRARVAVPAAVRQVIAAIA